MPVININTAANSALRYLNLNQNNDSSTLSKLASGSRINKAPDDASGLAVSTQLQSHVTELSQAAINMNRSTSALQIADGSMSNIGDMLARMKSLAAQSLSDKVTDTERGYIQAEFSQLNGGITTFADSARYAGTSLLNGSLKDMNLLDAKGNKLDLTIGNFTAKGLGVDKLNIASKEGAQDALDALDKASDQVADTRANIGKTMANLQFQPGPLNIQQSGSVIKDADVAAEKAKLDIVQVKTQAAIAALSQANSMPAGLLSLLRS